MEGVLHQLTTTGGKTRGAQVNLSEVSEVKGIGKGSHCLGQAFEELQGLRPAEDADHRS